MIKNILIYLGLLFGVFIFSIYYYAWFSWFLLLVTVCIPILSLLISLPFMIVCAIRGFSVFTEKEILKNQTFRIGITGGNGSTFFCPFVKIVFKASNKFAGKKEKLCFKHCGSLDKPVYVSSKRLGSNCGCIEISSKRGRVYDFMGIFFIPVKINCFSQTLVIPTPEKPSVMPDSKTLLILGYRAKPGGGFADNYELRGYHSGDSLKNIHWKLSSKQDELIVREPSLPVYKQLIIQTVFGEKPDRNDSVLARFIYVCRSLNENGVPFFSQANGVVSEIKSNEQALEYVRALCRGKAYNKCEIDCKNSMIFSILPDCEEVSES